MSDEFPICPKCKIINAPVELTTDKKHYICWNCHRVFKTDELLLYYVFYGEQRTAEASSLEEST